MRIEDLRRLRDDALGSIEGASLADEYERGAIMMGWEGLTDESARSDADHLRIEIRNVDRIGSHHVGRISTSLQNAVSYIAKYQQNPKISPNSNITDRDRERFEILQESQVGGTIVYRVPAIPMEDATLQIGKYAAASSRAVRELLQTLPQADDDNWTIEGVLGAPAAIRRAVQSLSTAVAAVPDGVNLVLEPERGGTEYAALSHVRADELRRDLNQKVEHLGTDDKIGLLDGLRGTRRVFYLVLSNGDEIAGAVDEGMVREVAALEHKRVSVKLETSQWTKVNGKRGVKAYRLLSIEEAPEQGDLLGDGAF